MSTDVFYTIGSTHQVCQDYAIAGKDFVIVADGCSSAKNSDWGARLLAKCLERSIVESCGGKSFDKSFKACDFPFHFGKALKNAHALVKTLGLEEECLAATLLCACKLQEGYFYHICGDGYIIAKRKNGDLITIEHKFESGAPYYLYYNLREELTRGYEQVFGDKNLLVETSDIVIGEKKVISTQIYTTANMHGAGQYSSMFYDIEAIAVVTDGLASFIKQTKTATSIQNITVPFHQMLEGFFSFKNTDGQFIHRRCQKEFKSLHSDNIRNSDDFAIGVVA